MTGNENPRITTGGENPKSHKHVDIHAAFTPTQPTEAWGIAGRYSALSANWEAGVEVFYSSIIKSISGAWEGNAATSAKDATTRYTKSAQDLTTPLTNLGARVQEAAQSIIDTTSRLPEALEEKPWWHKDSLPVIGKNRDSEIEDKQEEAQQIMKDYYVTPFVNLDKQVPVLPQPVDPTKPLETYTPGGDDPGTWKPTSNVQSSGDPGGSPTTPATTNVPSADLSTNPANTATPTAGTPTTNVANTGTPTTGAPTSPAATAVPKSNVPTTSIPRTGTPGSGNPGSGAPRSGVPGSGVPTTGTPKRSPAIPARTTSPVRAPPTARPRAPPPAATACQGWAPW